MKKFSFKKIITVSLFSVSIIFTSGFTICFTNTISTNHFNNDITAVDLSQYDGQYLPGAEDLDEKPSDLVILRCLVTAGWIEHENGIDISDIGVGGNQFKLTPRSGLNYYTGSATVLYTLVAPTSDISSIITNPMLDTTIDYDLWNDSALSKQYILSQFKQMYPTLDTNELDITADYSSDAVLKSGIGTATISVKSESLVYVPDSVDVQFRFKPRLDKVLTMGDLNINDFTTTSIYSPIWYIEGWHHNYDRLNNDCGLFEDTVNVVNSSTAADPSLTFSLKPSNTIFYSGSLPVTLSVFDQYIDTVPDDFSYTYDAGDLTASVTGFADPDHITHMNANRLYIPDTVEYDDQTYAVTSIAGAAFNVQATDSSYKQGLAYDLLVSGGQTTYPGISWLRLSNNLLSVGIRSFFCNGITGTITFPNSVTSIHSWDSFGELNCYAAYIPKYLTSMFASSSGIAFRRTNSLTAIISPQKLCWIESNSQDINLRVKNEYDHDGNIIGQFLMPTNGFNGSQLSSGLAWGKIDLTDAFNYDISTIKNIFLKYHLFVTEIIFPNTLSSFETQCLRWSDNIQSVTFPFWDGTQGVTGWATAFGYKHYCVINVPEEAISWYQSQSQYSGCTILPIL